MTYESTGGFRGTLNGYPQVYSQPYPTGSQPNGVYASRMYGSHVWTSGAIVARFTWDSPNEPRPKCLIVHESAGAYAEAYNGSAYASTGVDDEATDDWNDEVGNTYSTAGADRYTVKYDPPATFTVSCIPDLDATSANAYLLLIVEYKAEYAEVVLGVGGTIQDDDYNLLTLIGRNQVGSIGANGYELRNHNWSVSGPQLFASVTETATSHSYEPFLGAHTDETVSFYASKNGSESVGCACDAYLPGTNKKVASVTVTRTVDVRKPSFDLDIIPVPGSYTGYSPNSANPDVVTSKKTSQGISPYGAVGFLYHASNDEAFDDDAGTASICQLVHESSNYSPDGPYQTNGAELDNSFPYNGRTYDVDPFDTDPQTDFADADGPSRGLSGLFEFTINVNYTTTEMYRPNGGVDVPLRTKNWTWITSGAKIGSPGVWSTPTGGVTVGTGAGTDFDLLSATWYEVETNQP